MVVVAKSKKGGFHLAGQYGEITGWTRKNGLHYVYFQPTKNKLSIK